MDKYRSYLQFIVALSLFHAFPTLKGGERSREEYRELIERYPSVVEPQGSAAKGEIEIVLDEDKMAAIEKKTGRDVGIIARDKYWIWINDACLFPSGHEGVYGRILWIKSLESYAGVAVIPVLPNGKICLNCNFRHAARTWEIEIPRGGINPGEDIEAAAKRETLEETGMLIDGLTLLGEIGPDSGLTGSIVPIFMAKVIEKQKAQLEESEAIEEILFLSIDEIKEAFVRGYYLCEIRGVETRVFFRDPFLAYALLLYELTSQK